MVKEGQRPRMRAACGIAGSLGARVRLHLCSVRLRVMNAGRWEGGGWHLQQRDAEVGGLQPDDYGHRCCQAHGGRVPREAGLEKQVGFRV